MSRVERPTPSGRSRGWLRPSTLLYLYRRRLRVHAVQELFAGLGIAIAVALVFATVVAESSIAGSSREVIRTVAGPATLQVRSRGGSGFDELILRRVEHLPGVRLAAPILEQAATVRTPSGRHVTIDLAGTDTSLAVLDGLGETLPLAALQPGTIGLAKEAGTALGISRPSRLGAVRYVTLQMRGRSTTLRVSAVLGPEAVGALSHARVAVMPLARMQQLAGMPGLITRIFVEPQPAAQARVRAELVALAGGSLEVAPADQDVALLTQALGPSRLASGLFAAIGALLGLLLAFNAMLLTVPERRQAIAELRLAGARRVAIVQMVLFEALCLGACASLAGLLAGYGLSVGVFHQSSAYLAEAFTLGSNTILSAHALALAFCGGLLATCVASIVPLLDLRPGRPRDAVHQHEGVAGNALGRTVQRRLFAGALCLLLAAGALYALIPSAAIAATALLALGTVLALPLVFAGVLALMRIVADRYDRLVTLPVVLSSLRTTTLRSLALAATGAVALFGSVALGGSRENLIQGIDSFAHSYTAGAQVWVTNPSDNQAVQEIAPGTASAAVARIAGGTGGTGVAGVQAFQGGFLTLGSRRVWVIARPSSAVAQVLGSEIVHGAPQAVARLGGGEANAGAAGVGSRGRHGASPGSGGEAGGDARFVSDAGGESFVSSGAYPFPSQAKRRVGGGTVGYGWIAISEQIAEEHHTGVGGVLTLPTPTGPARMRIAATTTNLAWPPGVLFIAPRDYARLWGSSAPTALGVRLRPGVNPASARNEIAKALSAGTDTSGLEVATATQREASIDTLTSEGLGQLREISTLLLIAAICAMAAALASSLWQRRVWLSGLRLAGARPARLRRILALEAALMLGAGCLTGAIAGCCGQVVIDGYLRQVTGFPLTGAVTGGRPLEVFLLVLVLALVVTAIPGWLISRVPPGLALEGE